MRFFILGFVMLLVIGCASAGRPIDMTAVQQFEKGVTTQQEVRSSMGAPISTGITSEGETFFLYTFARSQVKASSFIPIAGAFLGGTDTDIQTLQIWFDEDGIMKNYTFNETTQDIRSGVNSY